jgi:DNA-binding transcriptional ArsR family regulator
MTGPVRTRDKIVHPDAETFDLATIMRTVGDPLRLEIVRLLGNGGEMTCAALSDAIGVPSSTGSYHMRLLREAGVTRSRPDGTIRHISLRRDDLEDRFPGLVDVLTAPSA